MRKLITNLLLWSPRGRASTLWWHDDDLRGVRNFSMKREESDDIPCKILILDSRLWKCDEIGWRYYRDDVVGEMKKSR
jgi:hypothetical protein